LERRTRGSGLDGEPRLAQRLDHLPRIEPRGGLVAELGGMRHRGDRSLQLDPGPHEPLHRPRTAEKSAPHEPSLRGRC
jgi:hypothetical protein